MPNDFPEVVELKKDNKYELEGYYVRDSYIINDSERFVIASKLTEETSDFEGLKLFYLIDNEIAFTSHDVGESYIYKPTFYKFKDNTILLACEHGYEYSTGIDLYEYKNKTIKTIGTIDVASDTDGNPESIIPNITIERKYGTQYHFTFKGIIYLHPGTREEAQTDGHKIKAIYTPETNNISLMLKN